MDTFGVLTGDIINSRKSNSEHWLPKLKEVLAEITEKDNWEIYRGDSFQLILKEKDCLAATMKIKSAMKSIQMDVRVAIGLGEIEFHASKISESNGSAFIHSGRKLELLKKETLGIATDNPTFNERFEVILNLIDFISSAWKPSTAEVVYETLKKPELNQSELAKILQKKSQGTISSALKRAGFEEIRNVLMLYEKEIQEL